MRVLISRLSALGDVVCTLPTAVALKRSLPDCHVTWVVDPRFAGVVECCGAVDQIVRYSPKKDKWPKLEGPFDAALDMQGLLKSSVPVLASRAGKKLGYHWQREGSALFSSRVRPDPGSAHIVDQYVDVARALGASADRAEFDLTPKQEDVLSVRAKLKGKGVNGRFITLNAGAGWATKRWPPASFAKLADALAVEGFPSVLLGGTGQADRDAANEVIQASQQPPASLVGETAVRELVALIRLSSVHVGGDTGSSHLAAALGVPAVGLYSITRPARSCPYGQRESCFYEPGGLGDIRPEAVIERVKDLLAELGG